MLFEKVSFTGRYRLLPELRSCASGYHSKNTLPVKFPCGDKVTFRAVFENAVSDSRLDKFSRSGFSGINLHLVFK